MVAMATTRMHNSKVIVKDNCHSNTGESDDKSRLQFLHPNSPDPLLFIPEVVYRNSSLNQ